MAFSRLLADDGNTSSEKSGGSSVGGPEPIKVVVWNNLVRDYFHSIHVSDVILLRGYKIKMYASIGGFRSLRAPYL